MASKSRSEGKNPSEVQIFENDIKSIALRIWLSEWSTDLEPIDVSRNIPDELFCGDEIAFSVRPANLWERWCLPIRMIRLSKNEYELQVSDLMPLAEFMEKFINALESHNVLKAYLMSHVRASYLLDVIPASLEGNTTLSRLAPQLKTYPYFEEMVSDCAVAKCDRLTAIRDAIPPEYEDIEPSNGFYSVILLRSSR